MSINRQVPFSAFWKLFNKKRPYPQMGLVFTCLSLFFFLPFMFFMQNEMSQPYENYNTEAILKDGVMVQGELLSISAVENVNVNGRHPQVISFKYQFDGKTKADKFQTMDEAYLSLLKPGEKLNIKVLNGEATITDADPYRFPFIVMLFAPLMFIVVGVILLLIGLFPALKTYRLYKHGSIMDGLITSLTPMQGRTPLASRYVLITYTVEPAVGGSKIYGEDTTKDFSILSRKKVGEMIEVFVSEHNSDNSAMVPANAAWAHARR